MRLADNVHLHIIGRLTAMHHDLLAEPAANAGLGLTHEHPLNRVGGPINPASLRGIQTHLTWLRQKLGEGGENPKYIFAKPRVGYQMAEGEEAGTKSP